MINKNNGITLVGLVITIIVLLIIAGISVGFLLGDNGIITKAQEASNMEYLESTKEEIKLKISEEIAINDGVSPTNEVLKSILETYGTVQYETDGVTVKGVVTTKKGYEILLSDLGTSSTNGLNVPDTVTISYEVKGIIGSAYNIVVKISDPNGIEKIVYKNSSGDDVTLNCDNNLEVNINYQVIPNTEYNFVIKVVGRTEKVKKVLVEPVTTILANGGWDGIENSPKLTQGMTGIYWDASRKRSYCYSR